MEASPNKEQVYDQQISPLMEQIIDLCIKHGIAMVADFHIPTPGQPDLHCTTSLPGEGQMRPRVHRLALMYLAPHAAQELMGAPTPDVPQ